MADKIKLLTEDELGGCVIEPDGSTYILEDIHDDTETTP